MPDDLAVPVTFYWGTSGGTPRTIEAAAAAPIEQGLPAHVKTITITDEVPPDNADEAWFIAYLGRHSHALLYE